MLHNEHVYKYWRWRGWILRQQKRYLGAELLHYWADNEREVQEESRSRE